jgi:phage tail-like protein
MAPRASRFDPYRTFKFRVRVGNQTILGVTKVTSLSRALSANELKEAGDQLAPRLQPGRVSYEDVTLEWGLSLDTEFEAWANSAVRYRSDPSSVRNFKRTVLIDVYDLAAAVSGASRPTFSYKLHRCWVSNYIALPVLDAATSGIGIQSLTLKHEGWERLPFAN